MNAYEPPMPEPVPPSQPAPPRAHHESWFRRPARLLKDSSIQAWLYFLLGIGVIVAWWFPARMLYQRYRYLPQVESVRDADMFVALTYEGVSPEMANDVSPRQFDEHIRALRQNGYAPIGLDDIRAFYVEKKPLPRKAVLITFEQSRKSSYFDTRDTLRRNRWKAVMFLWTKPIADEDPAALRWPYILDMAYSGTWDIGLQSHQGFQQVLADPAGRKGNYLTTPRWLPQANRYETPMEYQQRVREDHEQALAAYRRYFDGKPAAFAFPYGDFGQFEGRAALPRRLNLDLVAEHYDLGFISGAMALNTRHSDPRRLNRLLVSPAWDTQELIERLERAWPVATEFRQAASPQSRTVWITDWGSSQFQTNGIQMSATPKTTGAKMWLSGSDLCFNFQCRINFTLEEGQFGVFFRASPDSEAYVYFGIDRNGEAWLRQKFAGLEAFTLASRRTALLHNGPRTEHELELFVRDRVCFARLNGGELFGEGVVLRGEPAPGMVGLNLWSPDPGRARVHVGGFSLTNTRLHLVEWESPLNRGPYLADWINHNAYRITHLCPPWLDLSVQGPIPLPRWDDYVVDNLSRVYNLRVMPRVTVQNELGLDTAPAAQVAERAAALKADGVFVNMSDMQTSSAARILPWLQTLGTTLKEQGKLMMVRFPPLLEKTATFSTLAAMIPNLVLASDAPGPASAASPTNAVVAMEVVPPPPADINLGLYYEITGLASTNARPTLEMQRELLRQQGYASFAAGDFTQAINHWTRWHEMEPGGEEALMLIGDAYLRMGMEERAVEYYTRSLALNPGQITLAIRRARVLEQLGRDEESRDALNLYGRIFPQNVDILIAQAGWLARHNRTPEARELVERVLARHPDHLEVRLARHALLTSPEERYTSMRELIALGSQQGFDRSFGEALLNTELLATPEASLLAEFVARVAREAKDPEVAKVYGKLLPRREIVLEEFAGGKISDNWQVMASMGPAREGRYQLGASRSQTEAYLRLTRSELMRNGYMDVEIDEARGFFWVYARRSPNAMVRFGFEESGYLYLQAWANGTLLVNESRLWLRPRGHVRLRLEIIGDGAMGYVDGQPMFNTPISLPPELCFGWWGVAPFSTQPGEARALLTRIESGPLPVNLVTILPPAIKSGEDAVLEVLKEHAPRVSALVPFWFPKRIDGTFPLLPEGQTDLYRMLGKYYRSRILPLVDLDHAVDEVPADWLIECARTNNLSGFTLRAAIMPPERWFEDLKRKLEKYPLNILVLVGDPKGDSCKLRELRLGSNLLSFTQDEWEIVPQRQREDGTLAPAPASGVAPSLMVVDRIPHAAAPQNRIPETPSATTPPQ